MATSALLVMAMTILSTGQDLSVSNQDRAGLLAAARNWGYQLQNADLAALAALPVDLLVIDHARNGNVALAAAEVAGLRQKPDGTPRIVLSYLSIGEAEDYRTYWQPEWSVAPPSWLGTENPNWPGNYAVDFWNPDWQGLIFGHPGALLDIILDQGFDGVYLDRVDGYYGRGAEARQAMKVFVADLRSYAQERDPGFLIVQQNAEDLLSDPAHRLMVDGLAKEDLLFGVNGKGQPNSAAMVRGSRSHIDKLADEGKPVFVVEYDLPAADRKTAGEIIMDLGYVPAFATRALDGLPRPGM